MKEAIRGYLPIQLSRLRKKTRFESVMAHLGLAHYKAQCLELTIVNFLLLCDRYINSKISTFTRDEWDELFEVKVTDLTAKHMTFGRLREEAIKSPLWPSSVTQNLNASKEARDRISHRFVREHAENFLTTTGQEKTLAVLWDAIILFERTTESLLAEMKPLFESLGLTEEALKHQLTDHLESALEGRNINRWHSET
jgi:hypothetical protein